MLNTYWNAYSEEHLFSSCLLIVLLWFFFRFPTYYLIWFMQINNTVIRLFSVSLFTLKFLICFHKSFKTVHVMTQKINHFIPQFLTPWNFWWHSFLRFNCSKISLRSCNLQLCNWYRGRNFLTGNKPPLHRKLCLFNKSKAKHQRHQKRFYTLVVNFIKS